MGVHWALPMLQSLLPSDLWLRTNSAQPDPEYESRSTDEFSLFNGVTGEVLKTLPTGGMRRFSRAKLRRLITEGIDVKYGKTLSSISYNESGNGVFTHFSDGTSVSGDVLVGTDGPRSKARDLIIGEERSKATPAGMVLAVVRSKYTAEQALYIRQHVSFMSTAFHPSGTYIAIFPQDYTSPDPENWEWQIHHSSMPENFQGSDVEKLQFLKSRAAEYVGVWKNIIEWVPEGTPVSLNKLVYWQTVAFENREGRATLAGDAAHPMTQHRGQGLNHAICDVANLVAALKKVYNAELTLKDAISEYDTEMVKRGGEEVQAALLNAQMLHDWDALMRSDLLNKSVERGN